MAQKCILPERAKELKEDLLNGRISPEQITKLLPEEQVAVKAILEDIVTERLGIKVSDKEVKEINTLAKQIEKAETALGDNLGNPQKLQENIDFWKAKKKMEQYIQSKSPSPLMRILTGTIGRAAMLFSVKSPVLNIGSNIEVGFAEALSRRLSTGQFRGADNAMAVDYVKMVNKIYQETGYDISRMLTVTDTGLSGSRVLGEGLIHSEGPGKVREVSRRVAEDIVFKQLMGAPDVAFSAAHFADSANLNALNIAKGDKAKAKNILEDSFRLEPKTPEGEIVRNQAILDAQVATWTNITWASRMTEGLRRVFNNLTGDARMGDVLFPFIKTPSNVIATGLDYAGMGIPKAMIKTVNAIRTGNIKDKQVMQSITRDLVRSGLGLTAAAVVASQLSDDDFVGAFDPRRSQIEQLRNSNTNSFKMGDKWVSVNWLGPIAVPFTAIMYARKYGQKGWGERIFQYGKGLGSSTMQLPVIADIYDFVKDMAYNKNQNLSEMTGSTFNYITSQVYSRLIPSFMSDLAKALDPYERKATAGLESIQAKIPFARQQLPEKRNIFGEAMKGEPAWSDIIFGARVKTTKENDIIKEINRISVETDKPIAFTDWTKSNSKTLMELKDKIGQERYDQATVAYGQRLQELLKKVLETEQYKNLTPEEKLKVINNIDSKAMKEVLKEYK